MTDTDIDEEAVTMLRMAEEPSPRWRSPETISDQRPTIKKQHSEPVPAKTASPTRKVPLLSRGRSRQSKSTRVPVPEDRSRVKAESTSPSADAPRNTFGERVLRPRANHSRHVDPNLMSSRFPSVSQDSGPWPPRNSRATLSRVNTAPAVTSNSAQNLSYLNERLSELQSHSDQLRSRQLLLISMIPDDPTDLPVQSIFDASEDSDERTKIYVSWLANIESELIAFDSQPIETKTASYYAQRERLEADEYLLRQLWNTPAENYRNAADESLLDQMGRCSGWIKRLSAEQKSLERSISRVKNAIDTFKQHGITGGNSPLNSNMEGFLDNSASEDTAESILSKSGDLDDKSGSLFATWAGWSRAISPAIIVACISAGLLVVHNRTIIENALHVSLEMMFTVLTFLVGIAGVVGAIIFLIRIATSNKWKLLFGNTDNPESAATQETEKKPIDLKSRSFHDMDDFMNSVQEPDLDSENPSPMNISSPLHSIFSSGADISRRSSYQSGQFAWNPTPAQMGIGPPIYPVASNPVIPEPRSMPTDENELHRVYSTSQISSQPPFIYSLPRLRSPFRLRRTPLDVSNPRYISEKPVRSSSVRAAKHLFADPSKIIFHRHLAGIPTTPVNATQEPEKQQAKRSPSLKYAPYSDDNSCKPYGQPPARYQGTLT